MKLIELLELINENNTVQLINAEKEPLKEGLYDGKNSIDEKYNSKEIILISNLPDKLEIMIKTED